MAVFKSLLAASVGPAVHAGIYNNYCGAEQNNHDFHEKRSRSVSKGWWGPAVAASLDPTIAATCVRPSGQQRLDSKGLPSVAMTQAPCLSNFLITGPGARHHDTSMADCQRWSNGRFSDVRDREVQR